MSVVKVVNLLGSSPKGWEDAVGQAVNQASNSLENITGVEVVNTTGLVRDGKIVEYKANVNVAFEVENETTT